LLADGPLHGYELKAGYEAELVPSGQLNFGQVYTTLDRLQRDGLVAHEVVSQTERPDRKVYTLTEAGQRQLQEWLQKPTPLELDLRNETFLKLMLARRLPGFDPLAILSQERRARFEKLHEVINDRARAEAEGTPPATLLALDLAVLRLEAFLHWLDRCEEVLQQEKTK